MVQNQISNRTVPYKKPRDLLYHLHPPSWIQLYQNSITEMLCVKELPALTGTSSSIKTFQVVILRTGREEQMSTEWCQDLRYHQ